MATKQFNSRIQWKKDTSANWTQNNPVLLNGEIAIVVTNAGETRFKVGDGTSSYTALPFQDEYVLNKIPNVSEYVTAQDPVGIVDTVPPTFGGYTVDAFTLKSEIVDNTNSTATNVPLSANQGKVLNQAIQQNATNIGNIETEVESINTTVSGLSSSVNDLNSSVNQKLNLFGGTMTGPLIAQSNTNYTTGQVRNIYLSTESPTDDVGNNGDIWIVYGG